MYKAPLKKICIAALVLLYVVICFFREFLFLNINEQSRVTYYHDHDSHVAPALQWLSHFSYPTLYYSKWPLTFFFTLAFAAIAAYIVHLAFHEKKYVRITWFAYGAVFISGVLFYALGLLIRNVSATYDIARFLAGLVETPAMLAILCASFLALRRR